VRIVRLRAGRVVPKWSPTGRSTYSPASGPPISSQSWRLNGGRRSSQSDTKQSMRLTGACRSLIGGARWARDVRRVVFKCVTVLLVAVKTAVT
jgi:hypothetical protein